MSDGPQEVISELRELIFGLETRSSVLEARALAAETRVLELQGKLAATEAVLERQTLALNLTTKVYMDSLSPQDLAEAVRVWSTV